MGQKPISNSSGAPSHAIPASSPHPSPQNNKPAPQLKETSKISSTNINNPQPPPKQKSREKSSYGPLLGLIPRHIYNPDTKKILGVLSSEDLLLIALIFLFLESNEDDNPLMVLALVYVLLGDYIDFGDFAF